MATANVQHHLARKSARAGLAYVRKEDPHPSVINFTAVCVGQIYSRIMKIDEPRTSRLKWNFGTWILGAMKGKSGEIADELWKSEVHAWECRRRDGRV